MELKVATVWTIMRADCEKSTGKPVKRLFTDRSAGANEQVPKLKPRYPTLATFEAGALIKTPTTRKVQENTKYISGAGCRMKHTHVERKALRIAAEGRAAQES